MGRVIRTVIVLGTWPFVHVVDRLRGCAPPASLRLGLEWARTGKSNAAPVPRCCVRWPTSEGDQESEVAW